MAEYVERKYTAAKLSVALAIAAILGGLAARDQTADAADAGAGPHVAEGSITSAEVKNESLLFKDFRPGEIYSQKVLDAKFLKISEANKKYLKISVAEKKYLKIAEAVDAFVKVEDLAGAVDAFLKIDDANKTFVKIQDAQSQFVNGDGKVMTGFEASTGGATVNVLEIPGFVRAEGVPAGQQVGAQARFTNLGSTPLHYGTGGGAGVIAPGATQQILISGGQGGGSLTVQFIAEGSPPAVGTLTLSGILIGNATNFSGQILIGNGL